MSLESSLRESGLQIHFNDVKYVTVSLSSVLQLVPGENRLVEGISTMNTVISIVT